MYHADTTDEQIISYVKEAWHELAPSFEVAHPDRDDPDVPVEQIEEDLRAVLRQLHGPKAIISCYLPIEVATFHHLVDRTMISQSFGRWDLELFGRRVLGGYPELDEEKRAGVLKHGLWHLMGRYNDKHELWTCVDRQQREYGMIYDFNDGDPLTANQLVPDRVYENWYDFLVRLAKEKR